MKEPYVALELVSKKDDYVSLNSQEKEAYGKKLQRAKNMCLCFPIVFFRGTFRLGLQCGNVASAEIISK